MTIIFFILAMFFVYALGQASGCSDDNDDDWLLDDEDEMWDDDSL